MGTVVAVEKNGEICIAAETLTISGGSRKQTGDQVAHSDKIIRWGSSYLGTSSHPSWHLVLKHYISRQKKAPSFNSREAIFAEWLHLHQTLKEEYHLSSHTDEDDPFESSHFESLLINPHGLFKTYDLRSVEQFLRFAAIGSGSSYALGALHALYDRTPSAREIAERALLIACEFDDSSAPPITLYTVRKK